MRDGVANTAERAAERCPLCGGPNACGALAGAAETCWCREADIGEAARAAAAARGADAICLCARCAARYASRR